MVTTGCLTTHVLDTARGLPAGGIEVRLHRLYADGRRDLLCTRATNADGRTDEPLLGAGELAAGTYELSFAVGEYLTACGAPSPPFLDVVPVRFTVTAPAEGHHVPLLLSSFAYSVYRGS
ncbi:MAG: 5-hydroxyisourate hydrolase [Solirubrobacteraceae bacterium]|jgi:hydroxyisourate hydrolase|nr:5-hydroxyisourate hydrolase [Solirubrobacteraceae bacterium]